MSTLKDRHIRLDLIQTYKILCGVHNVDYAKYFTLNTNRLEIMDINWNLKHTMNTLDNSFNYSCKTVFPQKL